MLNPFFFYLLPVSSAPQQLRSNANIKIIYKTSYNIPAKIFEQNRNHLRSSDRDPQSSTPCAQDGGAGDRRARGDGAPAPSSLRAAESVRGETT